MRPPPRSFPRKTGGEQQDPQGFAGLANFLALARHSLASRFLTLCLSSAVPFARICLLRQLKTTGLKKKKQTHRPLFIVVEKALGFFLSYSQFMCNPEHVALFLSVRSIINKIFYALKC